MQLHVQQSHYSYTGCAIELHNVDVIIKVKIHYLLLRSLQSTNWLSNVTIVVFLVTSPLFVRSCVLNLC